MADTTIRLSGTYDSIEAYRILEEIREIGSDFEDIKEEAEAAISTATAASTAATNASNAANTAANNAQTYAGNANNSATAAAGSASTANTAATNAANSETNASNKANAAAASATAAATSETNAGNSATAAAASATAAAASESIASGSATSAASNASAAASSATAAANSALAAEDAAERAESFTPEGFEARVEALETQVPINTANIAQNAGGISANSKRISNIEKLLQGNLYDYQTDSTEAYTKTVPAGAMPYAGLERVGGKALVWNQVLRLASGTSTKAGVTMVFEADGTVTLSGTATEYIDIAKVIQRYTYILDHVYWLRGCPQGSSSDTFYINTNNGRVYADGLVFAANASTTTTIHFIVNNGVNVDGVVIKVQLTDMTLMFGAGNEPTLEQLNEMFPADYYEYNAGTLLSAGVTEVISKKADTSTIATYPVPAEIQALEGYGWSAYKQNNYIDNYIDFERKVFVKRVSRFHLGGATWNAYTANDRELFWCTPPEDMAGTVSKGAYIVCSRYVNVYPSSLDAMNTMNKGICANSNISGFRRVFIKDTAYEATTEGRAALKESLQGVYLYYELATPIETDISAYLSDDNLIEVEAGGTLTFPNSNGDDYRIPVPSTEEYMINLQEAVSNG